MVAIVSPLTAISQHFREQCVPLVLRILESLVTGQSSSLIGGLGRLLLGFILRVACTESD